MPASLSDILTAPRRPRRSLRSELLLWQLGTVFLVMTMLGMGTLLFSEQYVTEQFRAVREEQARSVLNSSGLAEMLQQQAAQPSDRDRMMQKWREAAGAALLIGWNSAGELTFDTESAELAERFVSENGQLTQSEVQLEAQTEASGLLEMGKERYYWRAEGLSSGQRSVGQAVVAFALPERTELLWATARQTLPLTFGVLVLALAGTYALSQRLKRSLLDLEPAEIAQLATQQARLLSTVQDSVIGIDASGQITVANPRAAEVLGLGQLPAPLHTVWPELARLDAGEGLRRQPLPLLGRVALVSSTPQTGGRLVAFTNRQEAARLAEQLTDTRRLVEGMRARTHEYGNRLHTIAGFLQLGQPARALAVIQDEIDAETELGSVLNQITEPRVAALLAGKMARARELQLSLVVAQGSEAPAGLSPDAADTLLTALGNYIENAFEALQTRSEGLAGQVVVDMGLDPQGFTLEVRDNGAGLPLDLRPFEAGHSTKGHGRGHGLAGVAALSHAVGGEVWTERRGP